jgi:asparagine synthase (glutamine-hydrolysing)
MCGILFSVIENNLEELIEYFQNIKHRGPDNSTYNVINNKFMGTHRLSIINQSDSGNQPFELDGVFLICNGQIYNYLELKKRFEIKHDMRSDVDIILHLYQIYKEDMPILCNLLDGDFAFVLYDSNTNVVHVSRDMVGVRPLFYSVDSLSGHLISVGSEVKSLKNTENVKINVFKPSRLFSFDYNQNIVINDLNYIETPKVEDEVDNISFFDMNEPRYPDDDIQKEIVRLLKKSVIKRIDNSERPVAFLCSGGLDSSIILCIANEYLKTQKRDMHVFTIKYADKNNNSFSEDDFYATQLVKLLNTENNIMFTSLSYNNDDVKEYLEKVVQQTETYDPNTIRTSIANYMLAKKIKENTDYKVFLSGEGADELFCGYVYFKQVTDGKQINDESVRLINNIHMYDVLKADRCFNAFGLEVRVPFLDKEFIQYIYSLDGRYKMFYNSIEKFLLRESFKNEYPVLVQSRIIDRPKERFSDGVSFSYVPELLNYCNHKTNCSKQDLSSKELSEKTYYKELFNEHYSNLEHIISNREMPEWCVNGKQSEYIGVGN